MIAPVQGNSTCKAKQCYFSTFQFLMGGIYRFTDNFALSTKSLNLWAMGSCFDVFWRLKHVFFLKCGQVDLTSIYYSTYLRISKVRWLAISRRSLHSKTLSCAWLPHLTTFIYSYQRIFVFAVTISFMKSLEMWLNHQTTNTILTDFQCHFLSWQRLQNTSS